MAEIQVSEATAEDVTCCWDHVTVACVQYVAMEAVVRDVKESEMWGERHKCRGSEGALQP